MNKKGQALIEFILIMPVFFILVMGTFDFGNILYQRYQLENNMDYIVELYKNNEKEALEEYLAEKNLSLSTEKKQSYTTIVIEKEIAIYTPGLSLVLGNPYTAKTNKVIYAK